MAHRATADADISVAKHDTCGVVILACVISRGTATTSQHAARIDMSVSRAFQRVGDKLRQDILLTHSASRHVDDGALQHVAIVAAAKHGTDDIGIVAEIDVCAIDIGKFVGVAVILTTGNSQTTAVHIAVGDGHLVLTNLLRTDLTAANVDMGALHHRA